MNIALEIVMWLLALAGLLFGFIVFFIHLGAFWDMKSDVETILEKLDGEDKK